MIFRPDYIEAIKPFINQPLVKILAGIRRCGKSTIFEMLKEELLSRNVPESCIIMKRYTEMDIPENITAKQMYDELIAEMQEKRNVIYFWMRFKRLKDGRRQLIACLKVQTPIFM